MMKQKESSLDSPNSPPRHDNFMEGWFEDEIRSGESRVSLKRTGGEMRQVERWRDERKRKKKKREGL